MAEPIKQAEPVKQAESIKQAEPVKATNSANEDLLKQLAEAKAEARAAKADAAKAKAALGKQPTAKYHISDFEAAGIPYVGRPSDVEALDAA